MESVIRLIEQTAKAARSMAFIDDSTISGIIRRLADDAEAEVPAILAANQLDVALLGPAYPLLDGMLLTKEGIGAMAAGLRSVAMLPSPINRVLEEREQPNGLLLRKISIPLGVVGVVYEVRPALTLDLFALCLKSGNATLLAGGSESQRTNAVLVGIIKRVLYQFDTDTNLVNLLPPSRAATDEMLQASGLVDVVVPRGSSTLVGYVRSASVIPIIESGPSVCHAYFEKSADRHKGQRVVTDAKTRSASSSNALDCLIVDEDRLNDLPFVCERLADYNVEIFADDDAFEVLETSYPARLLKPATEDSFGTEFLGLKLAIRTASSFTDALDHIAQYGSGHSEAIISEDKHRVEQFFRLVDADAIFANASTAFTEGAHLGLGTEMGISTKKQHARGPMGLAELTSYRWLVEEAGG